MAAEQLSRKRAEFLARAGQAFDRMFGADGQNGLVTFAQWEDHACEVTDELARWLMAEHRGRKHLPVVALHRVT
jgi:hypothetical protein